MKLDFNDGKYTVTDQKGHLETLRYGEPWRDHLGDNLIYEMAHEIEAHRSRKEPWASVMHVAMNRAIRAFREVSEVKQGTMTAVTKIGDDWAITVTGLLDGLLCHFTLDYLGFKPEDLEAP